MTPELQNIRLNLEHFLKAGTLEIRLSRRDVVHLLTLFRQADAPASVPDPADGVCAGCGKVFTDKAPPRVRVRGRGLMHGACADNAGIAWRGGS